MTIPDDVRVRVDRAHNYGGRPGWTTVYRFSRDLPNGDCQEVDVLLDDIIGNGCTIGELRKRLAPAVWCLARLPVNWLNC